MSNTIYISSLWCRFRFCHDTHCSLGRMIHLNLLDIDLSPSFAMYRKSKCSFFSDFTYSYFIHFFKMY